MALYHKWDVKNGFAYVFLFFSLISGGGVIHAFFDFFLIGWNFAQIVTLFGAWQLT